MNNSPAEGADVRISAMCSEVLENQQSLVGDMLAESRSHSSESLADVRSSGGFRPVVLNLQPASMQCAARGSLCNDDILIYTVYNSNNPK